MPQKINDRLHTSNKHVSIRDVLEFRFLRRSCECCYTSIYVYHDTSNRKLYIAGTDRKVELQQQRFACPFCKSRIPTRSYGWEEAYWCINYPYLEALIYEEDHH